MIAHQAGAGLAEHPRAIWRPSDGKKTRPAKEPPQMDGVVERL